MELQTTQLLIAILGVGVTSISCFWKIARDMRLDIKKEVDRMYERFDEHKDYANQRFLTESEIAARTFMRADNCTITQQMYIKEIDALKKIIEAMSIKLDKLIEGNRDR